MKSRTREQPVARKRIDESTTIANMDGHVDLDEIFNDINRACNLVD